MRRSLDRACIVSIERELTFLELASLAEWAERRSVPLDSWPQYGAARCWLDLAIGRAVDKARKTGRARSRSEAMRLVCAAFGLDGDSVRRAWERDQQRAREWKRDRAA